MAQDVMTQPDLHTVDTYQEAFRNGTFAYRSGERCHYQDEKLTHAWAQGVQFEYDLQGALGMKLHLPLKREYFEAIRYGWKVEEYREQTPYWKSRIEGREFESIVFTLGYPKGDDPARVFERPWRGYEKKVIIHPHFKNRPIAVYSIKC